MVHHDQSDDQDASQIADANVEKLVAYDEMLARGECSDSVTADWTTLDDEGLQRHRACIEVLRTAWPPVGPAGKGIDLDALFRRHPEYADELTKILPTIQQISSSASDSQNLAGCHAASDTDPPSRESPVIGTLGDYELLGEIGRGGMGVVYRARQKMLGRDVAVKVLPMAALADRRQLARFRNEVQATAALHHPHIVPIHTVGVERGIHYYAMQYIDGPSLAQIIRRLKTEESGRDEKVEAGAPAPSSAPHDTRSDLQDSVVTERTNSMSAYCRTVARWGLQAAQALSHAHENGVVHRDIKPGNLFLDENGNIWVADFGLARLESSPNMTMTGDVVGTLRYMAPEQALGKKIVVDHRADIYSLGATLYELISLHAVFDGSDREALLGQIASDEPRALHRFHREIPADLETVVQKAIAKDTRDRYQSADEMASDLDAFFNGKPIVARRPTIAQRLHRSLRRHPLVTLGLCAAILVIVLAAGWAVGSYNRRVQVATEIIKSNFAQAESAMKAGETQLARVAVTAAQTRIDAEELNALPLAKDTTRWLAELDRYEAFLGLYKRARRIRSVKENEQEPAYAALRLYHVLEDPSWEKNVPKLTASNSHATRVRGVVYELLLLVAYWKTRRAYDEDYQDGSEQEGLRWIQEAPSLLDLAEGLREPTKGYFWIRATCQQQLSTLAEDIDREEYITEALRLRQLADETPPQNAAELFYIDQDHRVGSAHSSRGPPFGRDYSNQDSLRAHREMLRIEPTYINGLYSMALRYEQEKNWEAALVACRAVLAQDPDDWGVRRTLVFIYNRLGLHDEAVAELRTVADHLTANDDKYSFTLGAFHELSLEFANEEGNLERAIKVAEEGFSRCLALRGAAVDPAPRTAHRLVDLLRCQAKEGNVDALHAFQPRLEVLAEEHAEYQSVLAHLLFGVACTSNGSDDERLEIFRDAVDRGRDILSQSPEDPACGYYVSAILNDYGNLLAVLEGPRDAEPLLMEAATMARRVWDQDKNQKMAQARLGLILGNLAFCRAERARTGQAIELFGESIGIYAELVEEDPDNDHYAQTLADIRKDLADVTSRAADDQDVDKEQEP